jgi:hypothetical protein
MKRGRKSYQKIEIKKLDGKFAIVMPDGSVQSSHDKLKMAVNEGLALKNNSDTKYRLVRGTDAVPAVTSEATSTINA